uniref:Uncharacterized protein n=1 Tax=Setaria italica TaxID=4555 RepID=K3YCF7_SETIT
MQAFDSELLESTSMDVNFATVWHTIGWDNFVPIFEEVDFDKAVYNFNRHSFWTSISNKVVVGKFAPQCNDIHNRTLRLMNKWLALSLFPRKDCWELTLPLAPQEEARMSNVSGRVTRSRSRNEATTLQYQLPYWANARVSLGYQQEWQQQVDTHFDTINTTLQQSHDDLLAYFCSQGFNRHPGQ